MSSKLSPKQEAFCREYLIDLNATQAAIRAGYSEKTANEQGSRLLANVKIGEFIAGLKTERNESLRIDATWVLAESKKSYEFNSQQVRDSEGNPKMVNATAASKFLELAGKHSDVRAFDSEPKDSKEDFGITKVQIEVIGASKSESNTAAS